MYWLIVEQKKDLGDNCTEDAKEESERNNEKHTTDIDDHVNTRVHGEVEGESEGEGDSPNEEDEGEEIDEEKTSKPKVTSDSDEETAVATKEESASNTNSSAKQKSTPKKLMNQFNFFERCALTEEIILRVISFVIILMDASDGRVKKAKSPKTFRSTQKLSTTVENFILIDFIRFYLIFIKIISNPQKFEINLLL